MAGTTIDAPKPGDIIRYRYLWAKEAADGYDAKIPRPCLVLHAAPVGDKVEVLVLPLTHLPQHDGKWMTVPPNIRATAGLDDYASYLVYSEANVYLWPSWDVIPVKARDLSDVIRGQLPHGMYAGVREAFEKERAANKLRIVDREKLKLADVNDYRRRRDERAFGR